MDNIDRNRASEDAAIDAFELPPLSEDEWRKLPEKPKSDSGFYFEEDDNDDTWPARHSGKASSSAFDSADKAERQTEEKAPTPVVQRSAPTPVVQRSAPTPVVQRSAPEVRATPERPSSERAAAPNFTPVQKPNDNRTEDKSDKKATPQGKTKLLKVIAALLAILAAILICMLYAVTQTDRNEAVPIERTVSAVYVTPSP